MSPVRRVLSALVLALAAVQAVPAAPAVAAEGVEQFTVTADAVTVSVRGASLDPGTLRVTLDGNEVAVTPQLRRQAAPAAPRIVLVVDTSGSMAGAAIVAAQRAAADFARRVPADASVGLVAFADRAAVLVRPTADRGAVLTALTRLRASGDTSLYDAVALGLSSLGGSGARRLVVLSDGADTASRTPLPGLVRQLRGSPVQLDAIALTSSEATSAGLQQLAAAAGGRVLPVSSAAALSAAFRRLPLSVSDQVTVRVPLPSSYAGKQVRVGVSIDSAAGVLTRTDQVSVPGPAGLVTPASSSRTVLWAGLAAVGGGLLLLLLTTVVLGTGPAGDRRRTRKLVEGYGAAAGTEAGQAAPPRFGEGAIARTAVEWAGKVGPERTGRRVLALDRANLRFSSEEWLLLQVTVAAAGAAVGGLVLQSLAMTVLLTVAAVAGPIALVRVRGARRMSAFSEQLPDSLRLISSSLMSGYAFPQALDGLVREGSEPIAGEISRALAEARLGVSLEDALDKVAERMGSKDLHWAVMAVRVQRDVGGNLAEVLNTVADTVRERSYLRRQVRTLTAEGRLSAVILVGMPVIVGLYTFANRREYMRPLWTTPPGVVMSVAAVGLLVTGALWMRKLVDVEV